MAKHIPITLKQRILSYFRHRHKYNGYECFIDSSNEGITFFDKSGKVSYDILWSDTNFKEEFELILKRLDLKWIDLVD